VVERIFEDLIGQRSEIWCTHWSIAGQTLTRKLRPGESPVAIPIFDLSPNLPISPKKPPLFHNLIYNPSSAHMAKRANIAETPTQFLGFYYKLL
jgi:hypothetical protein